MRGLLYTFTHAAIKYLTAFRLNGGGREERGEEGACHERVRSTASRGCTCPPSWSHSLRARMASRGRSVGRSVGSSGGDARREGKKRTGEKRRKKGEGESGTQEAPETGCGQLFTSWRMIHLSVLSAYETCIYVDLQGSSPPPAAAVRKRKYRNIDPISHFSRCFITLYLPF